MKCIGFVLFLGLYVIAIIVNKDVVLQHHLQEMATIEVVMSVAEVAHGLHVSIFFFKIICLVQKL